VLISALAAASACRGRFELKTNGPKTHFDCVVCARCFVTLFEIVGLKRLLCRSFHQPRRAPALEDADM
jgi:hypothetical protein